MGSSDTPHVKELSLDVADRGTYSTQPDSKRHFVNNLAKVEMGSGKYHVLAGHIKRDPLALLAPERPHNNSALQLPLTSYASCTRAIR